MADSNAPFAQTPLSRFLRVHVQRLIKEGKIASASAAIGYSSPDMLKRFASGEARVPLDKAPLIAEALGVSYLMLFGMGMEGHWSNQTEAQAYITSSNRASEAACRPLKAEDCGLQDTKIKDKTPFSNQYFPDPAAAEEGYANLNFKVARSFRRWFINEANRRDIPKKSLLILVFTQFMQGGGAI